MAQQVAKLQVDRPSQCLLGELVEEESLTANLPWYYGSSQRAVLDGSETVGLAPAQIPRSTHELEKCQGPK
jgi:hypothetical protein